MDEEETGTVGPFKSGEKLLQNEGEKDQKGDEKKKPHGFTLVLGVTDVLALPPRPQGVLLRLLSGELQKDRQDCQN